MLSWKERFPRRNEGLDLEIQLSVVGGQLSGLIASWNNGFDRETHLTVRVLVPILLSSQKKTNQKKKTPNQWFDYAHQPWFDYAHQPWFDYAHQPRSG